MISVLFSPNKGLVITVVALLSGAAGVFGHDPILRAWHTWVVPPPVEGWLVEKLPVASTQAVVAVGDREVALYGVGPISKNGWEDVIEHLGKTRRRISCQLVPDTQDQYRCYVQNTVNQKRLDLARLILRKKAAIATENAPLQYKADEQWYPPKQIN